MYPVRYLPRFLRLCLHLECRALSHLGNHPYSLLLSRRGNPALNRRSPLVSLRVFLVLSPVVFLVANQQCSRLVSQAVSPRRNLRRNPALSRHGPLVSRRVFLVVSPVVCLVANRQ